MSDLRPYLDVLSADAKPYGDAAGAVRTARRRRTLRQTGAAAAAALAVAGAVTLVALTIRPANAPVPQPPAHEPAPSVLYYRDGTTVLYDFGSGQLPDRPVGLVVNQVLAELTQLDHGPLRGLSWQQLGQEGGYRIVTTIDPAAQAALEGAADQGTAGSLMAGQPDNLQASGVVVEPGTGRVLAYYGNPSGTGPDFADVYTNEAGLRAGVGRFSPGGTFLVYTLAAALQAGSSLDSTWPQQPHGQGDADEVLSHLSQGRTCPDNPGGETCSLLGSVIGSLPVPFYDATLSIGTANVLELAHAAGIDTIWTWSEETSSNSQPHDLRTEDPSEVVGNNHIGAELGIGQYPVTVLDQANAMATFAAGGLRAQSHFVRGVWQGDLPISGETLPDPDGPRILTADQLANLTYPLTQLSGQPDLALKPGEWGPLGQTAHAWSVGYTSSLAIAVHVGNNAVEQALKDRDGNPINGDGLPTEILRQTIASTQSALGLTATPFPTAA